MKEIDIQPHSYIPTHIYTLIQLESICQMLYWQKREKKKGEKKNNPLQLCMHSKSGKFVKFNHLVTRSSDETVFAKYDRVMQTLQSLIPSPVS